MWIETHTLEFQWRVAASRRCRTPLEISHGTIIYLGPKSLPNFHDAQKKQKNAQKNKFSHLDILDMSQHFRLCHCAPETMDIVSCQYYISHPFRTSTHFFWWLWWFRGVQSLYDSVFTDTIPNFWNLRSMFPFQGGRAAASGLKTLRSRAPRSRKDQAKRNTKNKKFVTKIFENSREMICSTELSDPQYQQIRKNRFFLSRLTCSIWY